MKTNTIKNRHTGKVIFSFNCDSVKACVLEAIKQKKDLSNADLRKAYLLEVDLRRANLLGADLQGAYLSGADLQGVDLSGADLQGAYLSEADLSEADLSKANLRGADLRGADLLRANLQGADLRRTDLLGVNLSKKDLKTIQDHRTILPEGDIIGFKKLCRDKIIKLLIPSGAKRVGGVVGRKCRAEFAKVLEGNGVSLIRRFCPIKYKKDKIVYPDKFDPNPLIECSNGIHFFITRAEAEEFEM